MTSPVMTGSGCRRAMLTAAASRDRADASGGVQACSHARAAGSSRPTGSRSTPTLEAMRGNSADGGMIGPRTSQARLNPAAAGPYVSAPTRYR